MTMKIRAIGAYGVSARGIFGLVFALGAIALGGCSALPDRPARAVQYDFGPGPVQDAPADRRAPLPPLALADIESPGLIDNSTAVFYRLAYADAQQPRPYAQARWSQPPAQLLQQRLRDVLGQRRAILKGDDAAAMVRERSQGGQRPLVLRVDVEEFSHTFRSPAESFGLLRLRATLVDLTPDGVALRGQRVFTVQVPARTPDAAGGVVAMAEAATQAATELGGWIDQAPR
jgi:cholesterol transport system auxiliary component